MHSRPQKQGTPDGKKRIICQSVAETGATDTTKQKKRHRGSPKRISSGSKRYGENKKKVPQYGKYKAGCARYMRRAKRTLGLVRETCGLQGIHYVSFLVSSNVPVPAARITPTPEMVSMGKRGLGLLYRSYCAEAADEWERGGGGGGGRCAKMPREPGYPEWERGRYSSMMCEQKKHVDEMEKHVQ